MKGEKLPDNGNIYKPQHNYEGRYCWCDKPFPAVSPDETVEQIKEAEKVENEDENQKDEDDPSFMIQCYFCEDWFHKSCIGEMPKMEDFDEFVCKDCVAKNPYMMSFVDNNLIMSSTVIQSSFSVETVECRRFLESEIPRNIFLKENWRSNLCQCNNCNLLYPEFVKVELPIYEPEKDENIIPSHDAAVNLLDKMERSQVIHGIEAFKKLGDSLKEYLKPFAENGKIVSPEDVKEFFETAKKRRIAE